MAVPTLVIPVSGPYIGLWNGVALGTQNDDGFVLQGTYQGQEINTTDAFGMTLVEAIWRGLNWRMRFRGLEWNRPGILNLMQAFGSVGNPQASFTPILTSVGARWSLAAQTLGLISIINPPVSPTTIGTLVALNAIIAPQSNIEAMMTSKMREAPLELALLPYQATFNSTVFNVSFSTT